VAPEKALLEKRIAELQREDEERPDCDSRLSAYDPHR
jgi:hypothetical protein